MVDAMVEIPFEPVVGQSLLRKNMLNSCDLTKKYKSINWGGLCVCFHAALILGVIYYVIFPPHLFFFIVAPERAAGEGFKSLDSPLWALRKVMSVHHPFPGGARRWLRGGLGRRCIAIASG